jgi:uncharacterized membrane protein
VVESGTLLTCYPLIGIVGSNPTPTARTMPEEQLQTSRKVVRVGGKLRELLLIRNKEGTVLHQIVSPFFGGFHLKDVLQVMIGAAILSIPVGFTEETWNLAATLPTRNIIGFVVLSLVFIATFVYYNYHRDENSPGWFEFVKRTLSTYILALLVVGLILTLIEQAPWYIDWVLAIKRVVLVAFPASMSAVVADALK